MIPRIDVRDAEGLDPFDPRAWVLERPDDPVSLALSDRWGLDCLLDRQDREWAGKSRWCQTYGSGSYDIETGLIARPDHIYARRGILVPGATPSDKPRKASLWLHRVILTLAEGPPPLPGMVGDHINGNTLDDRRCNLRWATKIMNARNVKGSRERQRLVQEQAHAQLIAQYAAECLLLRAA